MKPFFFRCAVGFVVLFLTVMLVDHFKLTDAVLLVIIGYLAAAIVDGIAPSKFKAGKDE